MAVKIGDKLYTDKEARQLRNKQPVKEKERILFPISSAVDWQLKHSPFIAYTGKVVEHLCDGTYLVEGEPCGAKWKMLGKSQMVVKEGELSKTTY